MTAAAEKIEAEIRMMQDAISGRKAMNYNVDYGAGMFGRHIRDSRNDTAVRPNGRIKDLREVAWRRRIAIHDVDYDPVMLDFFEAIQEKVPEHPETIR
jgi:hypothetical protein